MHIGWMDRQMNVFRPLRILDGWMDRWGRLTMDGWDILTMDGWDMLTMDGWMVDPYLFTY